MLNKPKFVLIIFLLAAGVVLLSSSQILAEPPCEKVRIFDGGNDGLIMAVFNPGTCELDKVYICVDVDGLTGDCSDWGAEVVGRPGVICTCTGAECVDELAANVSNTNVKVDCHEIKTAGPRSSGCPIFGSTTYLYGGSAYRR